MATWFWHLIPAFGDLTSSLHRKVTESLVPLRWWEPGENQLKHFDGHLHIQHVLWNEPWCPEVWSPMAKLLSEYILGSETSPQMYLGMLWILKNPTAKIALETCRPDVLSNSKSFLKSSLVSSTFLFTAHYSSGQLHTFACSSNYIC